jgi:hypothetical protein
MEKQEKANKKGGLFTEPDTALILMNIGSIGKHMRIPTFHKD